MVSHQVDPLVIGTFHFFCREMEEYFSVFLHPNGVSAWALQEEAQNCSKGWSLVRPSMSLRHMHHCMSMNALEQGLLGLEVAKASDIDDFV